MPAKKSPRAKAAWRPSDVAMATKAAAKRPDDPNAGPPADAITTGARAIYEMRPHPRQKPWDTLTDRERAVYRERMQAIVAAIGRKRYVIDR